jgi:hypothetical protein
LKAGGHATGTIRLYGPFSSPVAQCTAANLVTTASFSPHNGRQASKAVRVEAPGYYTWVVSISADTRNKAATHPCGLASETTFVHKPKRTPATCPAGQPVVRLGC